MPELPEVETIRRQLNEKIVGKKIKEIIINLAKPIKGVSIEKFKKIVKGTKIKSVERRAKMLVINLDNGYSLANHLKMTGQMVFSPSGKFDSELEKYNWIRYVFEGGAHLLFNDMRKFGWIKLVDAKTLKNIYEKENYGPEPLEKDFTLKKFEEILAKKQTAVIKILLGDQKFIAGIGNIYASEILFESGIHPQRKVKDIKPTEIKKLHANIIKILNKAVKHRGTSAEWYVDAEGKEGDFERLLRVYKREKKECLKCGEKIARLKMGGRSAYFCPKCQK